MAHEEELMRLWLKKLLLACPARDTKSDCPMREKRECAASAQWAESIDEIELRTIIEHHKKCMEARI